MPPNRNTDLDVYLAKLEVVEGVDPGGIVAATNAIDLSEWFAPADDFAFQPSSSIRLAGHLHPDDPLRMAGLNIKQTRKAYYRGTSTAILSGNKIELDPWFISSGHASTYAGGAGVEHVDYTLADTNLGTMTEYYFQDGLQFKYVGLRGNMAVSFVAGGPMDITYTTEGRVFAVLENAVPSPTFITTDWPLATDMTTFSIDGYTAGIVQSWEHNMGNVLQMRKAVNATGGIQNWRISRRDPTFKVVLEEPLLSDKNFRTLRDNKTPININWLFGGTLYQKVNFAATRAFIRKVTPSSDNTLAVTTLEGVLRGANPYTFTGQ